jgi:hypothetical protein
MLREMILKTWLDETSKPKTRCIFYALAHALATRGGFHKAQIINPETGVIELETKGE